MGGSGWLVPAVILGHGGNAASGGDSTARRVVGDRGRAGQLHGDSPTPSTFDRDIVRDVHDALVRGTVLFGDAHVHAALYGHAGRVAHHVVHDVRRRADVPGYGAEHYANGAVNRAKLNWPAIRQRALDIASGAVTASDTHSAIAWAVGELDVNGHSRFVPLPVGTTTPLLPLGPSQLPSGKLLPGRIGYVALPGVEDFADQYQAAGAAVIRTLQAGHPDGWILDLLSDAGGAVWPMLGGIQPLLGSGPIGSFVSPPAPASVVRVTPTELTQGGQVAIRIPVAAQQGASTDPVVVLTGPTTASAGEFAAIVFRGRPCTTWMGSATTGVPTANAPFQLSDGATLILTTGFDADRTGHVYPDTPIKPDIEVGTNYNTTWNQADPTIRAATQWLNLHRDCKPVAKQCASWGTAGPPLCPQTIESLHPRPAV